MLHALQPHPDSERGPVTSITVKVSRAWTNVLLTFVLEGDLSAIALPEPAPSVHTDELWKHTCFEAFVRAAGAKSYLEFNFSPSTQWAIYRFDDYRAGMRAEEKAKTGLSAPTIEKNSLMFQAVLGLADTPEGLVECDIGLSAVIEEKSGAKSYWALAHAPGKPDFHNADCFTTRVRPA